MSAQPVDVIALIRDPHITAEQVEQVCAAVAEMIERERTQRMQYAGVIGFLCSISTHITDEDEQDALDRIVADWCALSGWSWRRLLDRVEVEPPALARCGVTP